MMRRRGDSFAEWLTTEAGREAVPSSAALCMQYVAACDALRESVKPYRQLQAVVARDKKPVTNCRSLNGSKLESLFPAVESGNAVHSGLSSPHGM